MRRVLLGLLIGALLFAGAVGAKVVTVTNPMSGDLDANGYSVHNAAGVFAADLVATDATQSPIFKVQEAGNGAGNAEILFGTDDPTTTCPAANPASLYLRRTPTFTGELWALTGDGSCAWVKVA